MITNKPIKLAIVTQFPADPEYPYGGVEAVSVNLVKSLSEISQLDVHVITLDKGITSPRHYEWLGSTIHRLPRTAKNELINALFSGRDTISSYISDLNPDIIHAHDTYGLMVSKLDYPRVFTVHGFIHGDTLLSQKNLPWIRSKIWKQIEHQGWSDQPHIISISPYVREKVSQVSKSVIHDIDNPISSRFFGIENAANKNIIFSAAVISPRKNTLNLINAIERLSSDGHDVELRLAGSVSNHEYGEIVAKTIKEKKLENKVKLLGRINSNEIQDELSQATIFALVSLEENSPMGIEEAMAAGIPVVTSNMCGMPYMVKDGESGFLVNPHDVSDIARRIKQIITDTKLMNSMRDTSRCIALERFHPDVVAKKTYRVYKDILNHNS
ncbi:MAG: glycosyltransferase family 4 protein [Candidatus Thiodiazotropha sp. (ex Myrtea sp. 'scaly one' KF741663)]|nr:glycosyltransferase family 4 protein [Candidatus Thiodiazotropha sp. (ex Myrtea sp. 'scaly one' KF741663)]